MLLFAIFFASIIQIKGCGMSTHTEVIERALANYDNPVFGKGVIRDILLRNQDAFQAGAPFPDAFYNSLCHSGDYHGQSEDIHWGQYQKVAWEYFRKTYPDPIGNVDAERLIAFILGLTSHQVLNPCLFALCQSFQLCN